jgi:two-component system KDP operon response regulator KdpE
VTRVLVVDDERQIVRALRASLGAHGYDVESVGTGEEALAAAAASAPDLMILDLGLPDMDGVQVIKNLRSWSQTPVIVLSVREGQQDKVAALDAGADDFVTKPFGMDELLARMRAAIRRTTAEAHTDEPVLRFGDIHVDLAKRSVSKGGAPVHMTPTEFGLLEALVTHPGKLLTHSWLLGKVWGKAYRDESHYLRVYVRQLRQKLGDDASAPTLIGTEPAIGYRWIHEPDDDST